MRILQNLIIIITYTLKSIIFFFKFNRLEWVELCLPYIHNRKKWVYTMYRISVLIQVNYYSQLFWNLEINIIFLKTLYYNTLLSFFFAYLLIIFFYFIQHWRSRYIFNKNDSIKNFKQWPKLYQSTACHSRRDRKFRK